MALSGASATFNLGVLSAGNHSLVANFAAQGAFDTSSATGTLTVTQAPLTVTAANAQRLYGQANPTTFMGTIAGIQNGDNITATYNTAATQASPVGAYPIVPTVVDPTNKLGNYTVTSNNGTLTVNPALLTITANNAAKTLNAPLPMLSASYSGFVNGDTAASLGGTLNCKTTATAASPVGSYPITCSGQTSTNYAIAYLPGTLTISYAAMGTMCDGAGNHVILPPINADGSSVFKQGRTVPAQFRVCDANGVSIGTPGVVSSFYLTGMVSGTTTMTVENVVDTNNPDTYFRWDPTSRQWIFNITTSNLTAGNTYVYTIALNDGSAIMFQYGLR
jgi:hypothetical protein